MTLPFRSDAEIEAAIPVVREHLARDGPLAYPTETVYGLGSSPSVPALEALARLKGRAPGKPFLLLVSSRAMAVVLHDPLPAHGPILLWEPCASSLVIVGDFTAAA